MDIQFASVIQKVTIWVIPVLFAITLHEVAHGWVASWFGDQTARLSGRLSINPLKHIDPVGTVLVPLLMLIAGGFIFGWAKPVPVDPRNLRHVRRDMALVSLAGPLSNLLMAFCWGAIAKVGMLLDMSGGVWLGLPLYYMGIAGIMINVSLAVLNLLPLPPLDGGRLLSCIVPRHFEYYLSLIEPYSFIILVLLLMTGVLSYIMGPPATFLISWIAGVFGVF